MFDKVLCMPPVLNIPGFWKCLCFWMCQSFGYTWVLNMLLILIMPGFWIYQGSEYVRVAQDSEHAWIIAEYAWICLNIPEYAAKCVKMSKSTGMAFVLHFPIFPFVLQSFFLFEHLVIYLNVCSRLEVIAWRNRLFSWRDKI